MYIFTFLQFYLVFTDVDVIVEEIDKSSGISKQQTLIKCEIYYRENLEINSIDGKKKFERYIVQLSQLEILNIENLQMYTILDIEILIIAFQSRLFTYISQCTQT